LGTSLFTVAASLFTIFSLLIKLALNKFNVSVAELIYTLSLWSATSFYILVIKNGKDVLDVHP